DPEERRQEFEALPARAELLANAIDERAHWQQPVRADQRDELSRGGEERDGVDEAEQAQHREAGEPPAVASAVGRRVASALVRGQESRRIRILARFEAPLLTQGAG